ncbi:MAG: hypothetical protein IKK77_00445 [Clostridia bacterium]|nr:hypothetical protein [Clostridia bacterium]
MLSKITSWRHSKIIAFVLAVAVFLTAFYAIAPVISNAAGDGSTDTVTYWDGTKASFDDAFANNPGDGSEGNPYQITTGDQLYRAVVSVGGYYFEIMNDIVLQPDKATLEAFEAYVADQRAGTNSVALPEGVLTWHTTALTAGNAEGQTFKGHIDGGSHTIRGLYAPATASSTVSGLVPNMRGTSSAKNITVDGAYITGKYAVGGIAGQVRLGSSSPGSIEACNVVHSYIKNSSSSNAYAGGITGWFMTGGTIEVINCSAFDNTIVSASNHGAGLVGTAQKKGTIRNCFTDDVVFCLAGDPAGYFIYENAYTTNSETKPAYGTGSKVEATIVTDSQVKGLAAYDSQLGFTPAHGWIVNAADGYPMYVGLENLNKHTYLKDWTGKKTLSIGDLAIGTDGNYKISTGNELFAALQNTEAGRTFDIINDIYLNTADSDANNWELWQKYKDGTTNEFTGTINGNGYTIYGYQDYTDTQGFSNNFNAKRGLGFIPVASNVTIKNLHFSDVSIDAWNAQGTGILIGTATGAVNIEGCSVINAAVEARLVASAFVGTLKENASADIKESVFGSGTLNENKISGDVFSVGAFVAKAEDGTTINLTDVVSNGYKVVGAGGTVTPTRAYAIGSGVGTTGVGSYSTFEGLKYQLRTVASVELSDNFYWDNVNKDTSPLLKNRIATKDKDIDGDGDTNLDKQDAAALVNIVLHETFDQLTLSDGNEKGYNDLDDIDITDIVYVYAN